MSDFQILILDNGSLLIDRIKVKLEWKGYQVTTAEGEHELEIIIRHQSYDLLIIDFLTLLPDDFSLLEYLEGHNLLPPTVVVSDDIEQRMVIKEMYMGSLDYVRKNPSFQKSFDLLNLNIFQALNDNPKPDAKQQIQINLVDEHKNTPQFTETTLWEYSPLQNTVYLSTSEHQTTTSMPYNEFLEKIHLEDLARVKTQNNICLFSHQPVEYNFRYLFDNSKESLFFIRIKSDVNKNGVVKRLYGHLQELYIKQFTHKKNQDLKLAFIDNTDDAVFISNAEKRIISVNKAFRKMCGYPEHEILNKKTSFLNADKNNLAFYKSIDKQLKSQQFWQGEVFIRHNDGHSFPVWLSTSILKDKSGHISQSISVLRDISLQKDYEKSIHQQANYDPLTQLPNRNLFLDRLTNSITQANRNNSKFALILLDLNKFKWINDTIGHHAGDILLQETAKKLQAAVRKSDTVARVGGDEFSIIVPILGQTTDAELISRKIFNAFKQPIFIDQQEVFISGSIGITIFPDDGLDIEKLQKNADCAMYIAKNKAPNCYCFYTQSLQQKSEKRLELISDIRSGMLNREFSLHYQPIIDVQTEKVTSAETLLRWNQPQSGYIPLNNFIPIAEECGLIREIGNWVIEEVANNIQRWSDLNLSPLQISVNQSVSQYNLPECHVEWLEILKDKHISPKQITFEISEKIFIEKKSSHINSIEQLKYEGIQFSLDGFGTGYSSLSFLKKFPVDAIKIDRSYIHEMIYDPANAILVKTIIMLANRLGIRVVATGVENHKQVALLDQQCRYVQGYYFSKPLPLNEFEEFVRLKNHSTSS